MQYPQQANPQKQCQLVAARGNGERLPSGNRVSVQGDRQLLEQDNGNGHTTLQMHLMPLNCTIVSG